MCTLSHSLLSTPTAIMSGLHSFLQSLLNAVEGQAEGAGQAPGAAMPPQGGIPSPGYSEVLIWNRY